MPTKKVRLGSLKLNLETERQGILDNKIPTQPVEQGKEVSDSIEKEPDVIEETLRITPRQPSERPGALEQIEQNQPVSNEEEDIRFQLSQLFDLRDDEKVFRYVAPERVIQEAAIQSIEYTRGPSVSFIVDLTIREILRKRPEESETEGEDTNAGLRSHIEIPDQDVESNAENSLNQKEREAIFEYLKQGGG